MSARRTFRDNKVLCTVADALEVGGNIIPQVLSVSFVAAANASVLDTAFFIANEAYTVTSIREIHGTLGTDAGAVTLQVTKATGTQAPSAGVALLAATVDLKGTINTALNPALTATAADLDLAAGNRLAVDITGVTTAVAGLCVTVTLKRKA